MPRYRLYPLADNGRIPPPPEDFSAPSDEAAINYAASKRLPEGCELWESGRFVALLQYHEAGE